nr:endonuclease domain-containing 1 protein isoform X2 [Nothobranchius furzeri]
MTFQQIWWVWLFVTTLPLLLLPIPTLTEVVKSVSECDQFLLGQTPPHVPGILEGGRILDQNRYKLICQTYNNKPRFVTLYDVRNKIPVFSAYKYVGEKDRKRPKSKWKIEPQLENENLGKNMMTKEKNQIYMQQGVDTDYRSNGTVDRGHIFPSSYGSTTEDKKSTFTLTNVVPQAESFNKGSWNRMERCTKCVMEKYCTNSSGAPEGFGLTGSQPSFNNTLNNRINIPSTLWSAFCCYSTITRTWIASAHWGDNIPDGSRNKHLETKTLAELQNRLWAADSEFQVFPGAKCPLSTTVTKFYPDIPNCDCPLFIPPTPTVSFSGCSSVTSISTFIVLCTPLFIYLYYCMFI